MVVEEYPVYNHKERPGIGRDLAGNIFYNCFTIRLIKGENDVYLPYLFSDFIRQYGEYHASPGICAECIAKHQIESFPSADGEASVFAAYKKFNPETKPDEYYYCPLTRQVLLASTLHGESPPSKQEGRLPAEPIPVTFNGSMWDDQYLFEFKKIAPPKHTYICAILKELMSKRFIASKSERSFFIMWFLSMFRQMEIVRQSGRKIYWEEVDFAILKNKLYQFIVPVPQVWVYIFPKPPPRVDWQQWNMSHRKERVPQRVDFLFIYDGKRHIIEIDDVGHYGMYSKGRWLPSEQRYRQTLSDNRCLKMCNFEVHRFTSEEVLELYDPELGQEPDLLGFTRLLASEGLAYEKMVFLQS